MRLSIINIASYVLYMFDLNIEYGIILIQLVVCSFGVNLYVQVQ